MNSRRMIVLSIVGALMLVGLLLAVTGVSARGEGQDSAAPLAQAGVVSNTLVYQGRLLDAAGDPVDGVRSITFSLYAEAVGGIALWSESQSVAVDEGLLTVQLNVSPTLFDGQALWLGVQVAGDTQELLPRQPLLPVPYAFHALSGSWSGLTGIPAGLDDGDDDVLGALSCSSGEIAEWDGSSWVCGGGGDITSVYAGAGMSGGGASGDVTLKADTNYLQRRVGSICLPGSSIRIINADGTVDCEPDDAGSSGDITAVHPGEGLSGGGDSGDVTVTVAFAGSGTAATAARSDHDHDGRYYTKTDLQGSGTAEVHWDNLQAVPSGLDDGDDDTTYAAGAGLDLTGTVFSVTPTYRLPQNCSSGKIAEWDGAVWVCGDDDTGGSGSYWSLSGNAGIDPAAHFLGTTDGVSLTLAVSGTAALRLEPHDISPNLIGGSGGNSVAPGVMGAVIGGGGGFSPNRVTGDYNTIGGGLGNTTDNLGTTVGGGGSNTAGGGTYATVSGGAANWASASYATVGGGSGNLASGNYATAGGGTTNAASGEGAVVAGGSYNTASDYHTTIGGGQSNLVTATHATVGGGVANAATGDYAVIGGGYYNMGTGSSSFVGGGEDNTASGDHTTVSGGYENTASGSLATVGGGGGNIASGDDAAVVGGGLNTASGGSAIVGGGGYNVASGGLAIVGGGFQNTAAGGMAAVVGGYLNQASGDYATVGGGITNTASGEGAVIAGGYNNAASDYYAAIGGGAYNTASDYYVTVGGGLNNAASRDYATICGGSENVASGGSAIVGGGFYNSAGGNYAAIGGGYQNEANGDYATIVGGDYNKADGDYSFAAGRAASAIHPGSFVWASSGQYTPSWYTNTFTARSPGGVRFLSYADGITTGVQLTAGGSSWASISDRNAKENFADVDSEQVLGTLAAMPIQTWNLKSQSPRMRHIGPVAQDFNGEFAYLFGEVESPVHINNMDAIGVSLAASQGLYELSNEQAARIGALEEENAALRQEMEGLEARLVALESAGETSPSPLSSPAVLTGWWWLVGGLVVAVVIVRPRRRSGGV